MADIDEEALFRGTNDDEDAQGLSSGRSRHDDPWEKGMLVARAVLGIFCVPSLMVLMLVSAYASRARDETKFSVHLAGYEGLNATYTHGHAVSISPVFNLKVRVENPRVLLQPWCYTGGEVTVSYSDVALAWGHVPRFCMKTRAPVELTVVPVGREVGLSEDLRGRLASDWRMGTAQIMADMKLFYEEQKFSSREYEGPSSLHPFQLML
ncbi:unnamed protein product [Urochloa decumbens]|uniref:Late embryogenesis abundant protein LEA-2 subgroup domain-containing protein n=1 Tax=Urochloa decumbens TaxID=240449 RepID=A0ABC8YPX2_9POAL